MTLWMWPEDGELCILIDAWFGRVIAYEDCSYMCTYHPETLGWIKIGGFS